MTTKTDFTALGAVELARRFNAMVGSNINWLDAKDWRPVKKFANSTAAVSRCERLEAHIQEHRTKMESTQAANGTAAASQRKAPARDPSMGPTLRELTEKFNEVFDDATKKQKLTLPPWAKHHTSDFASKDGAEKQTKRLQEAIVEAKKPKQKA